MYISLGFGWFHSRTSEEYGLGYVWSPDEITVAVGDSVLWNWYGTSFTRRLSVQQVAAAGETEPVEGGFSSESGVRGSFTHLFMETGDYYYIAGGYGHIGELMPYVPLEKTHSHINSHFHSFY